MHSGFAVVNSVKRANGRHLADLVLLLCDDRDLPEVQTPNGRVAFLAAQFITREELELCMKGNPDYFSAVLWEKTTPHGLSNFCRKPIITPQIEAACIEADESGLKDATDFQGDFEITRDAQGRTVLELGESGFEHFRRMLCKVLFLREEFTLRHENSVVRVKKGFPAVRHEGGLLELALDQVTAFGISVALSGGRAWEDDGLGVRITLR